MTTNRMITQMTRHTRIFMSFHHICLRTRLAPRRKPWADTARLSVLSCKESRRSPRWETLLMFSRITPTVSSICCEKESHVSWVCHINLPRRSFWDPPQRMSSTTRYVVQEHVWRGPATHFLRKSSDLPLAMRRFAGSHSATRRRRHRGRQQGYRGRKAVRWTS